ncbi:MAG: cell division protein FtsA [Deltaproteobacteria bacterium RIFCSPLOWO2_12_FULL_44_12]|nr:MAG: cell division protein FtsA [Deltaproteobacteria bacterium RIFCSPHIGHO2_01_FULL_43_49]OGQ14304.1 MAG: cell division protein FtsA [Deltaproteobacteria bacterium RIFCSPHIGHO2_02_FULL_44_53]OGQ27656.1 MAG: cell division protein FtsA [Deltaproteobacteria bacterium RIFCSPHIGHO2_12_FULL_44_21]OGQ30745.1 MAG: cell division protein FtsA [Deltaproteobacteria bacterium RIFCSPLOWO2_01_FULL_45_74]OGQ42425.1 MAG: cell division protein FtsA [Deltaproteobacteria bacterium RIFCSPLOWO2_02_FULL_44_34]OGQ
MGKNNWVVGLDIGTTKVCAIVGEPTEHGLDIVGIGTHPSRGLRKGVVVNIEATVNSIRRAVEEAELMSGGEITQAYTGIAGAHIKGVNSHGIVAIKDKEVKPSDVDRVIDAAQAIAIPLDRELIHVVPQEFVVDDQDGVKDPVGMSGVRLEAKVHIVTGAVTSAQNIIKCCNRAGLNVCDIILEQLASAEAVLSQDEKELGVALVDLGGGTTDIAIFSRGALIHTAVLSLGGNHVTNDVAVGLRTPAHEAERIKQKYGCALTSLVSKDETIEVPSVGGRNPRIVSRQILAEIIEPRLEEIFSLVRQEIVRAGCEDLVAAGIVVAGGTAILDGAPELAEQVFHLPVRRGFPQNVGGLVDVVKSPMFATGVGLIQLGLKSRDQQARFRSRDYGIYHKMKGRMKEWLTDIF